MYIFIFYLFFACNPFGAFFFFLFFDDLFSFTIDLCDRNNNKKKPKFTNSIRKFIFLVTVLTLHYIYIMYAFTYRIFYTCKPYSVYHGQLFYKRIHYFWMSYMYVYCVFKRFFMFCGLYCAVSARYYTRKKKKITRIKREWIIIKVIANVYFWCEFSLVFVVVYTTRSFARQLGPRPRRHLTGGRVSLWAYVRRKLNMLVKTYFRNMLCETRTVAGKTIEMCYRKKLKDGSSGA